ncbi:MAG: imidazole glycerol phosphate synthase subunit HisF [Rhodospirillales bacterium RIFCSPLOWO2_12_FULL_58_28]|nr:MAG: imidazole glycerol phosphate synthase subunit HisF [Rhodospirillales bacterium RIFCSPLOWO2_02_FULL_58_16]OHC79529.1 MAG: imidazole glycerol phosphate synthase subunit HisF [Rhodospirillales bacterium RIFCSPLOWO2_12_FULL_58_28]
MTVRIIPRLEIKGPNLVKGIHFEGLRVLGKPEAFARRYYESGADELIYVDAVASLYGRNSLHDIIKRTAREIFIPLTVGGGIRSLDDIKDVLRAGADKVAINTAAVKRPDLIKEASRKFGSSTIVVSIEAIRLADGRYEAFTDFGRESSGVDAVGWALRAVELGAGELLVTSIANDGAGHGYDIELIRRIAEAVPVPVIAGGGAGNKEHVRQVIAEGEADAVSIASLLHYHLVKTLPLDNEAFVAEGNTEFLRKGGENKKIKDCDLGELKAYLLEKKIDIRPIEEAA